MKVRDKGQNTICTHLGSVEDNTYKGAVSPLYMSTSYAYEEVETKRYPRYFNTPNQEGLAEKIAGLEKTESALVFGSGMAAISTSLLAFLKAGDHVVFQNELYGGTYNLICRQLEKYGISYTFTEDLSIEAFSSAINDRTKLVYVETPSNPLLSLTNLEQIGRLCRERNLVSMIDNTFASPINQNPATFGIDVVLHSATKYMGGHSDICAGAVAASSAHIEQIHEMAICLGGSLSDYTVWLLERSLKTMGLRLKAQNHNALELARYLHDHPAVATVYYPGLASHPGHELAKSQMKGFGGMLSFELLPGIDSGEFVKSLQLITPSMSLAGVESTILSPAKTSHSLMSAEDREKQGITDGLMRLSVGIEDIADLKSDLENALQTVSRTKNSVKL